MDVIKVEADADIDVGPVLSEFELVHFKQEGSPAMLPSVNSEFKVSCNFVLHNGVKEDWRVM
jgi:hypothetical protein